MIEIIPDHANQVICSTEGCGAALPVAPVGGITLLQASFPDDLDMVHTLLTGGVKRVYCSQCKKWSPYQSSALCVIEPTHTAFVYVPPKVVEDHPAIFEELRSTLEEVESTLEDKQFIKDPNQYSLRLITALLKTVENFPMEIVTNADQYQQRLAGAILAGVGPILASFSTARHVGEEAFDQWFEQNQDRLDRAFFAGALLLIEGAIPLDWFIAGNEETTDLQKAQDKPSPFPLFIVAGHSSQDEVLKGLYSDVQLLLVLRIFRLATLPVVDKFLNSIEDILVWLVPRKLVDKRLVENLVKLFSAYEQHNATSKLQIYTYHAVLAAICDLAGLKNPMQAHWARWYVAFELRRRTSKEGEQFPGLVVPSALATRTITFEQLRDQFIPRWKQAIKTGYQEQIEHFNELMVDLGLGKQWLNWLIANEKFIEDAPDDELENRLAYITNGILQEPESSGGLVQEALWGLAVRNTDRMIAFSAQLRQQMFERGEIHYGIWVTRYTSEVLNKRLLLFHLAKEQVEACIETLKAINSWPPPSTHDYIALLTEEGNCLRYLHSFSDALERYELCRQLLSHDLSDPDVRTNERNRAIVLREMGQIGESLSILSSMLPHTQMTEKAYVLESIASCQAILGSLRQVKLTLQQALASLAEGEMIDADRLRLLLSLASVARRVQDYELALSSASEAREIASREHNPLQQAKATGSASAIMEESIKDDAQRQAIVDQAIQELRAAMQPLPSKDDMVLRFLLAEQLEMKGEIFAAEHIMEETVARYSHTQIEREQHWALWTKLAEYAQMQGKSSVARSCMQEAQRAVINTAGWVESEGDPFHLMVDKDYLQRVIAEEFLTAYRKNESSTADLRLIADFQASVVLSRHLWTQSKPNEYVDNSDGLIVGLNDQQLSQLAIGSPTDDGTIAVLQAFNATSGIYLLLTEISHGRIISRLLPWQSKERDIVKLIHEISSRLALRSPAQKRDVLDQHRSWNDFSVALREAVDACISSGTHLCIIPGPLSGLPLQLILGQNHPLNYVPSLSIAHLLHRQRLQMENGQNWRPISVHDFIVWRVGEKPQSVEYFRSSSASLEANLSALGVQYTRTEGVLGSREALVQALQTAKCVRLSCHGRARERSLHFELVVAAGGQLPPADPTALDGVLGQRFLVDWQTIATLRNCAPLVFSAACASGLAISLIGGERVGLERPLFRAGTLAYVAPQWPVPVADIQPLINRIITTYIANPIRTLATIVFDEVNAAVSEGMPNWVARSVSVHGDWL